MITPTDYRGHIMTAEISRKEILEKIVQYCI